MRKGDEEVNTDEDMNEEDATKFNQCMPLEDTDEAIKVKVMSSPSPPSRQEMLEHNISHMPFRSWCPHCVAGKAKANKHVHSGGLEASETPVVSMDYMFMGDRSSSSDEDRLEEEVGDGFDLSLSPELDVEFGFMCGHRYS